MNSVCFNFMLISGFLLLFFFRLSACDEYNKHLPNNEATDSDCGELGDCPSNSMNCHKICGCDRFAAYYFNETTGECQLSFKHLMIAEVKTYGVNGVNDMSEDNSLDYEEGMAKTIRIEAEKIFQAILISVILFITCSMICVVSACFYCCRINYCDYKLKSDIKALSKKVKRIQTIKKPPKQNMPPISESCNIMCEEAGIFVV